MSNKNQRLKSKTQVVTYDEITKKIKVRKIQKTDIFSVDENDPNFWAKMDLYQSKLVGKVKKSTNDDMYVPSPLVANTLVTGELTLITKDTVVINIGKSDAFVDKKEFDIELVVGEKYTVHYDGANFSYIKAKRAILENALLEATKTKEPIFFDAKVIELIHGGYWMDCGGVRCFMPGSLTNVIRLNDFNEIVGDTIKVCAVGVERDFIILSHRDYLKRFSITRSAEYQKGQEVSVEITGKSNSGFFVKVEDNVHGMIPFDCVKKGQSYVNGDIVTCYVQEHDQRGRLVFTQHVRNILEIGHVLTGKIIKFEGDFAHVELIPGVNGTMYRSELKTGGIEGQMVEVVIKKMYKNVIHLKMR